MKPGSFVGVTIHSNRTVTILHCNFARNIKYVNRYNSVTFRLYLAGSFAVTISRGAEMITRPRGIMFMYKTIV